VPAQLHLVSKCVLDRWPGARESCCRICLQGCKCLEGRACEVQVSERTRSYLLVVRQTLLNTVPKAIVFHQVKPAEDHLLAALQAAVAGFEEEQLCNLLGEDPRVAETRKNLKARVDMLRKAVHEISSFTG
jgi:hypothetical protein